MFNFHVLAKITGEPPALPPVDHASTHILNALLFERKYACTYLADSDSREVSALRTQIAKGSREVLKDQYWDVVERSVVPIDEILQKWRVGGSDRGRLYSFFYSLV